MSSPYDAKPVKSGGQTTEFYITILSMLSATVLLALGSISPDIWLLVMGVNGAGYAVSRGIAKH